MVKFSIYFNRRVFVMEKKKSKSMLSYTPLYQYNESLELSVKFFNFTIFAE